MADVYDLTKILEEIIEDEKVGIGYYLYPHGKRVLLSGIDNRYVFAQNCWI